jgi:ATP-dependent RNA helicase DHX37/DHR1
VKITTTSNKNETKDEDKKQLPIIFHEREIMESLENNIVTIVCGETGSGKST